MPDRHGKTADVRSIYRLGDHVLVRLPAGLYLMEIRASEVIDGEVWFYGRRAHLIGPFTAACVVRRLTPGEIGARPELE
jgi:hypothetical protein